MVSIADSHSDYLAYKTLRSSKSRLFDHADLKRMQKGGLEVQVFAVWVPAECEDMAGVGQKEIDCLLELIEKSENHVRLCTTQKDMDSKNCIKAILAIESGESIGCSVERIEQVYDNGARMLSLTWNDENDFASGCGSIGGIKPKGIDAITELNRLKIALDLSHINEQGFWEVVSLYSGAPCASHSCVYDLVLCPRNLKTDQIEFIIKKDGYIGVNFYTEFLKGRYAKIDDILDHVEFILGHSGENAVGLGSDFCGIQYTPEGLESVADYQKIPEAMARRGYGESLIKKICYSNFVRYVLKFL